MTDGWRPPVGEQKRKAMRHNSHAGKERTRVSKAANNIMDSIQKLMHSRFKRQYLIVLLFV